MGLSQRFITALFALTLFLSAALLFSVQPMVAKLLLPLLGGAPSVWNTCMVFFQAVLLAGYGYAVVASGRPFKQQLLMQLVLLAMALLVLPIGLSASWVSSVPRTGNPSLWLIGSLTVMVGLPFFIVSSNAPLLQKWFAQSGGQSGRDPYFLYSASNAGSLIALLSYPVFLEPNFKLRSQSVIWTTGYGLLILLVALCGVVVWKFRQSNQSNDALSPAPSPESETSTNARENAVVNFKRRIYWLLLAFVPSSLMLGVTNFISTDIASVPLLWVIPLSLYLLTFVLALARRSLIPLRLLVVLLPVLTIVIVISNLLDGLINARLMIVVNLVYFFIAALTCHQLLANDRPPTIHLTQFYFWLSLGGVLGGVFNALLAPLVFTSVVEYPLVILLACLLLPSTDQTEALRARVKDLLIPAGVLVLLLAIALTFYSIGEAWNSKMLMALAAPVVLLSRKRPVRLALTLGAILLVAGIVTAISDNTLRSDRNFFGVLRVTSDPNDKIHWLFHGSTNHGRQSTEADRRCEALSYYHRSGPLGEVFASFRSSLTRKDVAVVGLGTGAMAAYAQPDERWTFYEINPSVVSIARNPEYFTYLDQCTSAPIEMVLGDARLRIEEAPAGGYGLIALDAFSSDAIPLHLITQEAIDLYLSKLAPNGLLLFHISNRHLDLSPVMADLAASRKLFCIGMFDPTPYDIQGKDTSIWVVMARSQSDTGNLGKTSFARVLTSDGSRRVWTDDFSNILSVLNWR
jgi:spermidine synthase